MQQDAPRTARRPPDAHQALTKALQGRPLSDLGLCTAAFRFQTAAMWASSRPLSRKNAGERMIFNDFVSRLRAYRYHVSLSRRILEMYPVVIIRCAGFRRISTIFIGISYGFEWRPTNNEPN